MLDHACTQTRPGEGQDETLPNKIHFNCFLKAAMRLNGAQTDFCSKQSLLSQICKTVDMIWLLLFKANILYGFMYKMLLLKS